MITPKKKPTATTEVRSAVVQPVYAKVDIVVANKPFPPCIETLKELGSVGKPHWFRGETLMTTNDLLVYSRVENTGYTIKLDSHAPIHVSVESLALLLSKYPITQA